MRLNELLAVNEHEAVLAEVNRCNDGLEKGKNELIALLQERGSIQSRKRRFATMLEPGGDFRPLFVLCSLYRK